MDEMLEKITEAEKPFVNILDALPKPCSTDEPYNGCYSSNIKGGREGKEKLGKIWENSKKNGAQKKKSAKKSTEEQKNGPWEENGKKTQKNIIFGIFMDAEVP